MRRHAAQCEDRRGHAAIGCAVGGGGGGGAIGLHAVGSGGRPQLGICCRRFDKRERRMQRGKL